MVGVLDITDEKNVAFSYDEKWINKVNMYNYPLYAL